MVQLTTHNLTTQRTVSRLLVLSPLYPPRTGGLENHAEQFNKHLAAAGHQIVTWTPHLATHAPVHEQPHPNLNILRFPAWEIIGNYPLPKFWHPTLWRQFWRIKNMPADIVISRTRFFITSPLAWLLARWKGVPWLHIEHGSGFVALDNTLTNLLARLLDESLGRLIFKRADAVVANSKASAEFVKCFAPKQTVSVIYRGIEAVLLAAITADHSIRAQHAQKILITYVGRLIAGKGVGDLLHAFAKLPDNAAHLLIIGTGPQESELKRLANKLNIYRRLTFYGDTPWLKAIALMKDADIIVNPSYTEGLPTAVIEAALCRRAVIATNVGGTPEIIQHEQSGYLVPPKNPAALRQALQTLISEEALRRRLGKAAYTAVINRFTWAGAVAAYQQLFNVTLDNHVRHRRKN